MITPATARIRTVGRLCESARPAPKRLRRLDAMHVVDHPVFFLTFCTAQRARLLANAETHTQFLEFCQRSPELANVWVGRYVLMPDHIHVFVCAEGSSVLSRWCGSVKKFMAAYWREQGHVAPFWQEGFFDHLLRSNESYEEKWEYVRQNPVRAGLTNNAGDWSFAGEVQALELSEGQQGHADSQSRPTTAKQQH